MTTHDEIFEEVGRLKGDVDGVIRRIDHVESDIEIVRTELHEGLKMLSDELKKQTRWIIGSAATALLVLFSGYSTLEAAQNEQLTRAATALAVVARIQEDGRAEDVQRRAEFIDIITSLRESAHGELIRHEDKEHR